MLLILLHQVSKHSDLYSQEFCKEFFVKRSWKIPAPHPVRHTCSQPQTFQLSVVELCRSCQFGLLTNTWANLGFWFLMDDFLGANLQKEGTFLALSWTGVFLSIMWVLVQGSEPYAPACLLPCGMRWICLLRTKLPAKLQSSFYMFLRTGLTRYKRNE